MLLGSPAAFTADEPAPEPAPSEAEAEPAVTGTPAPEAAPQAQAPRPRSTDSLRETVTETMRTFTPSESIDVDKPVDFPANI